MSKPTKPIEVKLHGSEGQRKIQLPTRQRGQITKTSAEEIEKAASLVHQRRAFAIVKALKEKLKALGKTDKDVWERIRERHGVKSRSEFSAVQWAIVAAELATAQNNRKFLIDLVTPPKPPVKSTDCADEYRVYSINMETAHTKKVYAAPADTDRADLEKRGQVYAERVKKMVRIVQASTDYVRVFTPTDIGMPY